MDRTSNTPSPEYLEQLYLEERARQIVAETFSDPEAMAAIRAGLRASEGELVDVAALKRKY